MRVSVLYIASLLAAINAFTITSPSEGQTLDPTEPITFSWTTDSTDPDTFDIILDNSAVGGLTSNVKVASGVSSSSGSYIISTKSVETYGDGFVLKAESLAGDVLATSPSFALSMGVGTSPTYTGSVSEGPASMTSATSGSSISAQDSAVTESSTTTGTADAQATLGGNSDGSTASSTTSVTGSNSFTTSTVSRSGSSTGTSSSSSPSATTSQNAQPKLGSSSQIAFTAAGLIAGLAALLA